MKNIHSKILISVIALSLCIGGATVSAQSGITLPTAGDGFGTDETQPIADPRERVGPVPAQNTTAAPATAPAPSNSNKYLIKNPLSKTTSLSQVLLNVVSIVRILLIMAAVLYLLYAGFMFVTARGDSGKIVKARNALLWGCVGIALILAAQVIITTLQNTVNSILS